MTYQLQVPIGNMPINLVLLSTGVLAFVKLYDFGVIYDISEGKIEAVFMEDGFRIGETEFNYNMAYNYKNIPEMLAWLQRQNLEEPIARFG